jgi:hypothetical protein
LASRSLESEPCACLPITKPFHSWVANQTSATAGL